MKNRKIILFVLIIIWLLVIFGFSNQTASNSLALSDSFTMKIVNVYCKVFKKDMKTVDKNQIIKDFRFYIRKTAHFTLYLILGLLVGRIIKYYSFKYIVILAISFCFLYSVSDEIHQNFIENRTPKVLDVLIDTAGSFTGIVISSKIYKKNNKNIGKLNI